MAMVSRMIRMYCLFSRSYSFQWKALKRKTMSIRKRPMPQSQPPKAAPQISAQTMPMMARMQPANSNSLRYLRIITYSVLFLVLGVHADGHRTIVQQFHFHVCAKLASAHLFANGC